MNDKTFQTSDIALAAFLLTVGCCLLGVDTGRKATFKFENKQGLSKQIMQFVNCQASVEPSAFLNNLKTLKGMANGY